MKEQLVTKQEANSENPTRITFSNKKHPKEGPRTFNKMSERAYKGSSLWCDTCGFGEKSCKCKENNND